MSHLYTYCFSGYSLVVSVVMGAEVGVGLGVGVRVGVTAVYNVRLMTCCNV